MNTVAFDCSDGFDSVQGRFGRSERSKALTVAQEALHGGVIALDQVVAPFSVEVPDAVEVRIIAMMYDR